MVLNFMHRWPYTNHTCLSFLEYVSVCECMHVYVYTCVCACALALTHFYHKVGKFATHSIVLYLILQTLHLRLYPPVSHLQASQAHITTIIYSTDRHMHKIFETPGSIQFQKSLTKINVFGPENSGKTCLVKWIFQRSFI